MIVFNRETLKWEGITVEQVKFWESVYKDVDVVEQILKRMPAWLDAHPHNNYKNWKAFINGWLQRDQRKYDQFKKGVRE